MDEGRRRRGRRVRTGHRHRERHPARGARPAARPLSTRATQACERCSDAAPGSGAAKLTGGRVTRCAATGLIDFFDAVLRPIIDSAYRRFRIGTYSARSVAVDAAAAEPLVAVVEPNSSAVPEPEAPGAAPDRSSSGTNDHRSDPTAMEGDVESRIDEQSEGSWPSPAPRDVEDPGEASASGDAVASFAAEQQEAAERTEGDESQPSAAVQERGEDQAAASPPESDDVASSAE